MDKTFLPEVKNLGFTTKSEDLDNLFRVHEDEEFDLLKPNLNETIYFDLDPQLIVPYILDHPLHWPTISYRLYGTVRLAWFLMKLNSVTADRCFERVEPGSIILTVDKGTMQNIVNKMVKFMR